MQTASIAGREPVVVERAFATTKDRVWRALTELDQMRVWYFPQIKDFRAEVGFETEFTLSHKGKDYIHQWRVTEVVPGRKISYEWAFGGYPGTSLLTIELFEQMGATWLRLTHTGIETFRGDLFPDLSRENFVEGWTSFIGTSLRNYLEV
ncbi:SRPBCC family protein [Dinghuibacter silviterrae]|uniref:Uncharacterized protein YndB with AHSA1/START domain n=1 Tax=Dinghuibacter silviterrae TaxID=1539049 RepID=A0A4R8DX44_9BACT|nr:SRPBCC domain-containing protein [Dinghuibacter silviterrae]TDX02007.1 uncharacterized protein YndB with AHSA1/START domain [Dinghuibacter silviterrae]